jgi:hypothetical protein
MAGYGLLMLKSFWVREGTVLAWASAQHVAPITKDNHWQKYPEDQEVLPTTV